MKRPIINYKNIPDPSWIAGFVSGEGNFDVCITQSTNKIKYRVQLRFRITQHEKDIKFIKNIILKLGSGNIYKYPKVFAVNIIIVKFSDITNIIIPFFNKYSILGVKLYDYLDWYKIHNLMNNNLHLTLPKAVKI